MKVTVLGCGGSLGVPTIRQGWGRCDPNEPRNQRRRCSILVEQGATAVLVDTTPDLRVQMIDAGVKRLDAVIYTHEHADHVNGIDDLRPMTFDSAGPVPAYMSAETHRGLTTRFGYALSDVDIDRAFYRPILTPHLVDGPFRIGELDVVPFVQDHGTMASLGLRFGPFAYSTDVVGLSEEAFGALDGVDTWIVDATREEPHMSHAHLDLALEWIERLAPRQAFLTHMNHTMDYRRLCARLPAGVAPAFDGLVLEF